MRFIKFSILHYLLFRADFVLKYLNNTLYIFLSIEEGKKKKKSNRDYNALIASVLQCSAN